MTRRFRLVSALVVGVTACFVACALNPGVDLPKGSSESGTGGSVATGAGGSGATGGSNASGGSSGSAGTAPATGGGATTGGSGGVPVGAAGANDSGEAGAPSDDEPYANVTGVTTSGSDASYTFNVSVESSDVDCTEFANWWEVLTEDGTLVYRRILEHSHTDENGTSDANAPGNTFTRDGGPVEVGADETLLVRAHVSTGGYNGVVMRGSVTAGFAAAPDIARDFAAAVETEAPQPTGCQF